MCFLVKNTCTKRITNTWKRIANTTKGLLQLLICYSLAENLLLYNRDSAALKIRLKIRLAALKIDPTNAKTSALILIQR